jgi:hypothetical protein
MEEFKFSYKITIGKRFIIQNWLILYMYRLSIALWLFWLFITSNIFTFDTTISAIVSDQLYILYANATSLVFTTTIIWFILIELGILIGIILSLRNNNFIEEIILRDDKIISHIGNKTLEFNYNSISNPRILGKYIFLKIQNVPGLIFTIYIEDSELRQKVFSIIKEKSAKTVQTK